MRHKFIVSLKVVIALFLLISPAFSQSNFREFSIEHIKVDSGISNKTITAIVQDKDGYMWFGTESGLNRYDGYSFKIFKNEKDDPNSLSCNRITFILCDSRGDLWVGTSGGGINKFRKKTEDFERIYLRKEDSDNKADIILSAFEARNGDMWFGTWGEGLVRYRISSGEFRCFKAVHGIKFDISNRILRIFEDSSRNLWIGTRNGLYIFDRESEKFTEFAFQTQPDKHYSVSSIYEDSSGQIWVGTYNGLFYADPGNMEIRKPEYSWAEKFNNTRIYRIIEDIYKRLWIASWSGLFEISPGKDMVKEYSDIGNPDIVLTSSIVLSAYIDRTGLFWIGTMKGLNYFNSNRTGFKNWDMRKAAPEIRSSCFFTTIFEGPDKSVWLGTLKKGLIGFNRTTGEIKNIRVENRSDNSIKSNVVMNIKGNNNGDLYIGTTGGFSIFEKNSGKISSFVHDPNDNFSISNNEIVSIMEYKPGVFLLGTMKGLNLLDIRTGRSKRFLNDPGDPGSLSANLISSSLRDRTGRIWVSTYGGGLNRYRPDSGDFERISEPVENGLKRYFIYPLVEANDGILWMGSNEAGLKMFDPEKKSFRNFFIKDGLPSNTVWDVLEDEDGNIWFSTSEGISRLSRDDYSVTNFGKPDGVMIDFFNFNSGIKGASGEMFFSGENGFVSFSPGEVIKISFKPQVVITSVRKLGKEGEKVYPGSAGSSINFTHQDRMLTFEFSALSFLNPKKNRFRYKLSGLHDAWNEIGDKHSVTFGHLRPGKYIFNVTGSNCFGDWNEQGAAIEFSVIPAFWQTWWFLLILFILLLAGVFLFYRQRVKIIEKKLRDETDMEKLFRRKKISKREKEIVLLVIQGKTSREIEDKLFISYGTVKNHIYSIYKKLNVKNRAEMVHLFKDIKSF